MIFQNLVLFSSTESSCLIDGLTKIVFFKINTVLQFVNKAYLT